LSIPRGSDGRAPVAASGRRRTSSEWNETGGSVEPRPPGMSRRRPAGGVFVRVGGAVGAVVFVFEVVGGGVVDDAVDKEEEEEEEANLDLADMGVEGEGVSLDRGTRSGGVDTRWIVEASLSLPGIAVLNGEDDDEDPSEALAEVEDIVVLVVDVVVVVMVGGD
jgi:hypothetical protein